MEVKNVQIGDIRPYEKNPRINKDAVEYVSNSIKEFGFQQPIVVDKDMIVIAGHTRLKAAKKLKLKEVPVVIADNLTEEQVKAYRLADNKTNEFSVWDFDLLDEELFNVCDKEMELFGFLDEETSFIDDLLEEDFAKDRGDVMSDIYNITFSFPVEKKEFLIKYIKNNGKTYIVNMILKEVESWMQSD